MQGKIMKIWPCEEKDIPAICAIYNYYIENTVITFEEVPVPVSEMSERVKFHSKLWPWLVCEVEGAVVGYAYASKWKERAAYKNSVEISVYIQNASVGKGYGKALCGALLDALTKLGCHVVIGGVALPNAASIALHEHFGFQMVAHFSEVGFKFGRWVDVAYWQKILKA
jgi:L-amino acid N-acyltransferase YncA